MSQRLHLEIPVPPYFLCPISLELMRDPVTVSSGHTFDRPSIEKWLDDGHCSCPVTRQAFDDAEEPIPNHVLRRMIQAWCVENRSLGIERIATPRQAASLEEIQQLIDEVSQTNGNVMDALQRLNRIAHNYPRTRKQMVKAGALSALASSLSQSLKCSSCTCSRNDCFTPRMLDKVGETLRLLALLEETEGARMLWEPTEEQILSIARCVAKGKADARQNAASILSSRQLSEGTKRAMGGMEGFMLGLVTEAGGVSPRGSTSGLKLMLEMCSSTGNRVLATEAGAVEALVRLLRERRGTELVLKVLEAVCGCAEGRAAMWESEGGIEAMVETVGSMSERATRHAVETLWLLMKWAPSNEAKRKLLTKGAFEKLLALAQTWPSSKVGALARQTLKAFIDVLHTDPK